MAKVAYLEDEGIKVAREMVKGTTWLHRSFIGSIGASEVTIFGNSDILLYPTVANTFTIYSSSTNDTSSGTGVRTLTIEGLDSNYNTVIETVTLNGTSNVTTSNSFIRFQRATVASAGTLENNDGTITIKYDSAQTIGVISPRAGQSQSSVYTIPRGKTGYLVQLNMTSSKNSDLYVSFRTRLNSISRVRQSCYMSGGPMVVELPYPTVLPQFTDVELRGIAITGNANLTGIYDILLIDNPNLT